MNAAAIMRSLTEPPAKSWVMHVHTVSEPNQRFQTAAGRRLKSKRVKEQREFGKLSVLASGARGQKPSIVRLTRIAPREMDSDNWPASAKALRDGLADGWGCEDSKRSGIEWTYAQERGRVREYAVKVEVWL